MQVNVGQGWESLMASLVEEGRYASADEVVEEGLRLIEERERKRVWLRTKLDRAVSDGGAFSDADIEAALRLQDERLQAEGF